MPFKTKEEKSEYDRKRYIAQRESKLAYMKEYRKNHPEVREAWANKNRDKINANKRAWRDSNRDKVLEQRKAYEQTDRAKVLQKARRDKWVLDNPLKAQESKSFHVRKRRGLLGGNGKISKSVLSTLLENMNCGICGSPIDGKYHIDHIIPVSKGGEHVIENLQLTHPICNLRKGAKILV